jgi:hypothetical protein
MLTKNTHCFPTRVEPFWRTKIDLITLLFFKVWSWFYFTLKEMIILKKCLVVTNIKNFRAYHYIYILCRKKFSQMLVPHSQCSLRENPKFLQNFRPKSNTLKGNVWPLFSFYVYHSILGLHSKVNTIILFYKIVCIR